MTNLRRAVANALLVALLAVALATSAVAAGQAPSPNTLLPNAQGLFIKHYSSAASTNSTLVSLAGAHALYGVNFINTSGSIIYVKLYNKATAPTCGTDAPLMTISVPATSGTVKQAFLIPLQFSLGIGFCATGALADADTTNTGTGATFDFGYK